MTQPALSNAVNDALTACKAAIQRAIGEATVSLLADSGKPTLEVAVAGFDVKATIDPKSGAVHFGGEAVAKLDDLLAVADAVHKVLGGAPAVEAPVPPVHIEARPEEPVPAPPVQ